MRALLVLLNHPPSRRFANVIDPGEQMLVQDFVPERAVARAGVLPGWMSRMGHEGFAQELWTFVGS